MTQRSGVRTWGRRQVMKQAAALGIGAGLWNSDQARGQGHAGNPPVRLALLVGNRDYPSGQDLPPITKNVRDLKVALEAKGFQVTDVLNPDLPRSRSTIAAFCHAVAQAPADATVFFYYSGHGVQDQSRNLLICAGVNPTVIPEVQRGSLEFGQDIVLPLAPRAAGATYAVLDSCRVNLRAAVRDRDGLNQVEAPAGCFIAFSTRAGQPAVSPDSEDQNTFYTASLLKILNDAKDDVNFAELFQLVRKDVRETMLNHPVAAIRAVAQDPFMADNVQVHPPVVWRSRPAVAEPPAPTEQDAEVLWEQIQQSLWPSEIVRLARQYLATFPTGRRAKSVEVTLDGSAEAARLLQRNDIKLYRSSFQPPEGSGEGMLRDFKRAARGDKDAAKRLGQAYLDSRIDPTMDAFKAKGRYEGWLQYATALGNGIASYDLALLYRARGQDELATRYEQSARLLGFTPPPSLDNKRK